MPQILNSEMIRTLRGIFVPLPANLGARVYGSTQDVGNGAYETIEFDTEHWDTGSTGAGGTYPAGMWDVANDTRLTAVHRGWHAISGHLTFSANAVGIRGIAIQHSVDGFIARDERNTIAGQFPISVSITTHYWMNAGEYVELMAYQNSGGVLPVGESGNYSPEFVMVRIP